MRLMKRLSAAVHRASHRRAAPPPPARQFTFHALDIDPSNGVCHVWRSNNGGRTWAKREL